MMQSKQEDLAPKAATLSVSKDALQAFGHDLTSLMMKEGADFYACLRDAAAVNFGYEDTTDEVDTCLMFKEAEEGVQRNFQALHKGKK